MKPEEQPAPDPDDLNTSGSVDDEFAVVYNELRGLAAQFLRHERSGHTLQPTGLVHEAYLRLAGHPDLTIRGRSHILALAARAMRRILVDQARRRQTAKRGFGQHPWLLLDETLVVESPKEFIDLDRALNRFAGLDPRASQIVELKFFGGLTAEEIGELVGLSDRMVRNELAHARAWLRQQIS